MRIYTKIVIDLNTSEVLHSEFTEYSGPVAQCGGSKSKSGDTVDRAFNAGMLALSQEQQSWARELFNMFKYGTTYDPYEKDPATGKTYGEINGYDAAQVSELDLMNQYFQTQARLMPYEEMTEKQRLSLEGQKMAAEAGLIPLQTASAKKTLESGLRLLPQQEEAQSAALGLQTAQATSGTRLLPYQEQAQIGSLGLQSAQAASGMRLLPYQERAQAASLGYDAARAESGMRLLPLEEQAGAAGLGLYRAQSESGMRLLPLQEETERMGLRQRQQILTERSPVISQLYKDALAGVDVNRRVSEARAGVQHAFAGAETNLARNLSRYGLAPGASDFRSLEIERAKGMAGAEGNVRRDAETENFQRRTTALGLNL